MKNYKRWRMLIRGTLLRVYFGEILESWQNAINKEDKKNEKSENC